MLYDDIFVKNTIQHIVNIIQCAIFNLSQFLDKEVFVMYEDSNKNEIQNEFLKHKLSKMVEQALKEKEFEAAAEYKDEIARICHQQGKERDAYFLEHSAYELRQLHIYQLAKMDVSYFEPEIPDVELLKSALTELAQSNREQNNFALFAYVKAISLRICRAQGKERDAYLLECELAKYANQLPLSEEKEREAIQQIKRMYYIHGASNANDQEEDFNKAYNYLCKAVEAGWEQGYRYLGDYHYYGRIDQTSFKEALENYKRLADTDEYCNYMYATCLLFQTGDEETASEKNRAWENSWKRLNNIDYGVAKILSYYVNRKIENVSSEKVYSLEGLYQKLRKEEEQNPGQYIYRGQNRYYHHPLRPSGYRGCRYSRFAMQGYPELQIKKSGKEFYFEYGYAYNKTPKEFKAHACMRLLSAYLNNALGYPLTQALCQQAGYNSEGIDVTDSIDIAFFFAAHIYQNGQYLPKQASKAQSVIYRWKKPKVQGDLSLLHNNYYTCPGLIPTKEILSSFKQCNTEEEFSKSFQDYKEAIGWGRYPFYFEGERPYHLLRLPSSKLQNSRIFHQEASLLMPDCIPSQMELNTHRVNGFQPPIPDTGLPYKLVEDLSASYDCEIFLVDYEKAEEGILKELGLPNPDHIYRGDDEDISHMLTKGIIETMYQEIHEMGSFAITNSPMPGYQISYYDLINQLQEWQQDRESYQYFFV